MANTVRPEDLSAALEQTLTIYSNGVTEDIDSASKQAMKELVSRTKATAPKGARGSFRANIASKEVTKLRGQNRGKTYVWYVKAPDHRLTHLLVHGHATKNGGRTRPDPFLRNALDQVLPEYEAKIEEAIRNGN